MWDESCKKLKQNIAASFRSEMRLDKYLHWEPDIQCFAGFLTLLQNQMKLIEDF